MSGLFSLSINLLIFKMVRWWWWCRTFLVTLLPPQQVVFSQDPPVSARLRRLQEVAGGQEGQHVERELHTHRHTNVNVSTHMNINTHEQWQTCEPLARSHAGMWLVGLDTHLLGQQWNEVSLELRLNDLHHVFHLAGVAAVDQFVQSSKPLGAAPPLQHTDDTTVKLLWLGWTFGVGGWGLVSWPIKIKRVCYGANLKGLQPVQQARWGRARCNDPPLSWMPIGQPQVTKCGGRGLNQTGRAGRIETLQLAQVSK